MNQNDARQFLMSMSNIAQYVPPMLFTQVTSNPICRVIEQIANGQATAEYRNTETPQTNGDARPHPPGQEQPPTQQ